MALLPNFGPPLEQTHELLPMEEMEKLRNAIQAKANEARVTFTMVEEVARDGHHTALQHLAEEVVGIIEGRW